MNTLTISIALFVLVTLLALAIHSGWQSYQSHRQRKAKPEQANPPSGEPGEDHHHSTQNRLRSEPSLDTVLAQDSAADGMADLNDILVGQDHAASVRNLASSDEQAFTIGKPDQGPGSKAELLQSPAEVEQNTAASATTLPVLTTANAVEPKVDTQPSTLSERVDCVIEFALEAPISGQRLLHATQTIRRFGSKAAGFDGLLAVDHKLPEANQLHSRDNEPVLEQDLAVQPAVETNGSPVWQVLQPSRFYRSFRMAVLLANRHGALNPMEFAEFTDTANKLAAHFGALAVIPDMTKTLEYARKLDAECIKLDAQLGMNIDCANPPSAADLVRVAREQGLVERGPNRYARIGRHEELLFTLSTSERANRLTLLLDVPRAPIDQQPWPALLTCAHETMTTLHGQLVDDAGRLLSTRNLDSLSAELAQRYAMLDQSGFKAGSALAIRVFN